jgi:uncharacterized Zn-finger protein
MVTIARSTKNADRVYDLVGTVARIAHAGTIRCSGRIVAARTRLEHRSRQATRDAVSPPLQSALRWSPANQRELEHALDRWDNEGGARPPGRAVPADHPPTVPLVGLPRYANDIGVREIRIGAREFRCIGALPPHDHPHIYLNMEGKPDILCPYCSTIYTYDNRLRPDETEPEGCFYAPMADEVANPDHGVDS